MRLLVVLFCAPLLLFSQYLPQDISYLALGDSYTIGASVIEEKRWPNQFIDSLSNLGYNIEKNDIIAVSGWTTTSLLNAMESADLAPNYNLISILIGVNNFYQSKPVDLYREELSEIIDSALVLANQDTNALFLVTIPDYGYTPFGESNTTTISSNTDLYNNIKGSTADEYGIPVYDITDISREGLNDPELVAIDGLHPSAKQYDLWVDLILEEMLSASETASTLTIETPKFELIQDDNQFQVLSNKKGEFRVFNLEGRLIRKGDSNTSFQLPKGVFVFQYAQDGKITQQKLSIGHF